MNLYETMLAILMMIFLSLRSLLDCFRGYFKSRSYTHNKKTNIKVGLLTNEIPPIVYGGVATWIVNFIRMFEEDDRVTVIPIFLAYNDALPDKCYDKYKDIRVIEKPEDINECFADIDVCVNNLWIALETIVQIKEQFHGDMGKLHFRGK